jgi:hypothetical protein
MVYSTQHYIIKFVSNLRQVGGFRRILRLPPPCIQYLVKTTSFIFCDFDRKNMGSVFHAICYTFPGPNCFVTVLKYHYIIKFVSNLRQVGGFRRILRLPPPIILTATT